MNAADIKADLWTAARWVLGVAFFGVFAFLGAREASRSGDAQRLRYWTFQVEQSERCRKAGGFPIETWGEYHGSTGGVYSGCSFKPAVEP